MLSLLTKCYPSGLLCRLSVFLTTCHIHEHSMRHSLNVSLQQLLNMYVFFKQGATIGFHDFPVHCSASEAVKYLIVIINMMCFMAFSGKTPNMVDLLLCERSYKNKKSLQKPFVKLSY